MVVLEGAPEVSASLEGLVRRGDLPVEADVLARRLELPPPIGRAPRLKDDLFWARNFHEGFDGEVRARTRSGPDGRWSLGGLGPGLFHLEAVAEDGARGRALVSLGAAGLPVPEPGSAKGPRVLSIQEGRLVLRGRAVLPDGSPWTGLVELGLPRNHSTDPAPVRPDAEGRFTFEGLPAGEAELRALVPGRRFIGGPSLLLPTEEEVRFVVGDGRREVEGRILAAETELPVKGAVVRASMAGHAGIGDEERPEVDGQGRFTLHLPPEVSVFLEGEAPGWAPASAYLGEDAARDIRLINVRLHRPSTISGFVRDGKTGKALAGVTVGGAVVEGLNWPLATSVSDADGRYTLRGLPAGRVYLQAQGSGWIAEGLGGEVTVAPAGEADMDLTVVPAPRVQGRVIGPSKAGVPGVTVRARELPEHYQRVQARILHRLLGARAFETVSGPGGAFDFPLLPQDRAWSLIGYRDGVPVGCAGPYPALSGATVEVVLPVPEERLLEVRVVDGLTGAAVPRAEVTWWVELMPTVSWPSSRTVPTGPDGVARIGPVPATRYSVGLADSKGFLKSFREVPPDEPGPIVLRVSPDRRGTLTIEGRVVRGDGTPAAAAEWSIEGAEETPDTRGATDSKGAFRARGLRAGPWTVKAQLWGSREPLQGRADVHAGDREVVVTLRPWQEVEEEERPRGEAVRARITAPDGSPIPRGRVEWRFTPKGKAGSCIMPRDFTNGETEERPPVEYEPGDFRLAVSAPTDASGHPMPLAGGVFGPFPVPGDTVTICLNPEAPIEGRIVDDAGTGIAGAAVRVEPSGDDARSAVGGSTMSGVDGRFRIGSLEDRAYTLHVEAWDAGFGLPAPLAVRGGATGVEVRLRKAYLAELKIVGPDGKPVPHARVRVRAEGTTGRSGWPEACFDALGVARLSGLDPEVATSLLVDPPEDRKDLLPWRAQDWKPAATEVRMARGWSLVVHVVDPAGAPVEAVVLFAQEGQPKRKGQRVTDVDGFARLPPLPPGPVKLQSFLRGDLKNEIRAEAVAPAESGLATLSVDPGADLLLTIAGDPADVTVFAHLAEAGEASFSRYAEVQDGRMRFRGLRPDAVCDVYVWQEHSGRCVLLRGVRPGTTDVFLRPGRAVTGQVLLPEGARLESVAMLVGEVPLMRTEACADDGFFRFLVVPEGRCRFQVVIVQGEAKTTRTIEAEVADKVELDLREVR